MIKRIRVIYDSRYAVWSGAQVFSSSESVPLKDRSVIFDRSYERGHPVDEIWREVRESIIGYFFLIFYPAVVDLTRPPRVPVSDPDAALRMQSKNIRERQAKLPEYYIWNPEKGKWHMSSQGYMSRTLDLGGPMRIGFSESLMDEMKDMEALEEYFKIYKGMTQRFIIFVYPDRYDEQVRAMFILEIEFY